MRHKSLKSAPRGCFKVRRRRRVVNVVYASRRPKGVCDLVRFLVVVCVCDGVSAAPYVVRETSEM